MNAIAVNFAFSDYSFELSVSKFFLFCSFRIIVVPDGSSEKFKMRIEIKYVELTIAL